MFIDLGFSDEEMAFIQNKDIIDAGAFTETLQYLFLKSLTKTFMHLSLSASLLSYLTGMWMTTILKI